MLFLLPRVANYFLLTVPLMKYYLAHLSDLALTLLLTIYTEADLELERWLGRNVALLVWGLAALGSELAELTPAPDNSFPRDGTNAA